MPRGKWLDENDRNELRDLYESGLTHREISQKVGICREAVGRSLQKAGGSRRRGPAKKTSAIPLDQLRQRYESGESIASLSRGAKIGVRALRMRLIEAGATLRVERRGWRKSK